MSIITATYNSSRYVRDCIRSVHTQSHPNIEHIIIDGKSTDNTLELIGAMPSRIAKIVSEPDEGIYDAMNKGVAQATGDIVGILNSDDFYPSTEILSEIVATFERTGCDAVFGNLDLVHPENTNRVLRHWRSSPFVPGSFRKGWHPPHPTFFVKREMYTRYGTFDAKLDVSADFELMLRFIEKHGIRTQYLDKTIVKMRHGGESTGSVLKILQGSRNIMIAFRRNGVPVSPLYPARRMVDKLCQYLKKEK